MNTHLHINEEGFYGQFGGAFVAPSLRPNLEELAQHYASIIESESFQHEFRLLLRDYVGRPSPLYASPYLSKRYGARVFLKREDLNFTGAHKINNAVGQILLARHLGKHRIIAETGAGQHGVATATVCAHFDMPCTIFMGACDIERQRSNVQKMQLLGAEICAVTEGNGTLNDAVNAALSEWTSHPDDTFYLLGSAVGPHPYPDMVARLQAVISEEIKTQLFEQTGTEAPDFLLACIGGGSNAAGTFYHYVDEDRTQLVLAEAGGKGIDSGATAATLSVGRAAVLHGSRSMVMLSADDEVQEAYSISAGLDYPGVGPLHASLVAEGRAQVVAVTDQEAICAALQLIRHEGIVPAIESAHALSALEKLKMQPDDIVVVTLSGRGDKDMGLYLKVADELNTEKKVGEEC